MKNLSTIRFLSALFLGLLGATFIWIATPYNNYVVRSVWIADSCLPFGALLCVLIAVLLLNPILLRWFPRQALNREQLVVIFAILLVGSVIPSQGLLRYLPYILTRVPPDVQNDAKFAEAFEKSDIPPSLFPSEIGYGAATPESDYFRAELPQGVPIPWGAWIPPLLSHGSFLVFLWIMMVGLSLIVFPQWYRNERLAFPLLTVQAALIEPPEKGRYLPEVYRNRAFWTGALVVLGLYMLEGGNLYFPDKIPAIPLKYDLSPLFTEPPVRFLPGHISKFPIYFIFLGVAFFAPTRISFSVWGFVVLYALYIMYVKAYFPMLSEKPMDMNRAGAMLGLTPWILWLGRHQWIRVGKALFRQSRSAEENRNRQAGWLFLAGLLGMFLWLVLFGGLNAIWAMIFVGMIFIVGLLAARMVAETGIPMVELLAFSKMLKLGPLALLTPVVVFFGHFCTWVSALVSRVSPSTMSTHAFGLAGHDRPGFQLRLAYLFVPVLLLGLVISGASHLTANYRFSVSLDGVQNPINKWGSEVRPMELGRDMKWVDAGAKATSEINSDRMQFATGFGMASLLYWASLSTPRWPLHPIGILVVNSFPINRAWFSIFLGWLAKVLILHYGGARLYKRSQMLFLGLMMGEVFAGLIWSVIPAIYAIQGLPYQAVEVQPY